MPAEAECDASSYCCPEAKKCLVPAVVSAPVQCLKDTQCPATSPVCCPVTHLCVTVGDACTAP